MRHAKSLQTKSRTHTVRPLTNGWEVTSGTSGNQYIVRQFGNGAFHCGCTYHQYHTHGECSHVAAVRNGLAQTEGRTVILHDSVEAYRRSHRRLEEFNDGLIITSRAAA